MRIGVKIHRIKSCPSTNDAAKELAMAGGKEGTVIISEEQTRGKGTRGRNWYSARKKGIYLSVILHPSRPNISLLPLMAGLAVNEAIFSTLDIRTKLKWPNDLLLDNRKFCGILTETGEEIKPGAIYVVLVNSFMYAGGSGFRLQDYDPDGNDTAVPYRQPLIDWIIAQGSSAETPIDAAINELIDN